MQAIRNLLAICALSKPYVCRAVLYVNAQLSKHSAPCSLFENFSQTDSVTTDLHAAEMMCHLSMQLTSCRAFSLSKSRSRNCLDKRHITASSFRCSRLDAVGRRQNRGVQEEEGWQTANRTLGSNSQTLRGAASGVVLNLLSPLPCLAQEHNGLFAIAGIL